jgi:hypothetical protein
MVEDFHASRKEAAIGLIIEAWEFAIIPGRYRGIPRLNFGPYAKSW